MTEVEAAELRTAEFTAEFARFKERQKLAEELGADAVRRNQHSLQHPERLVSFALSSEDGSVTESDSDPGGYSSETTALDTAFLYARGSWQKDMLTSGTQAHQRFIFLMPHSRLSDVRPQQRCSVLFAYDYKSKVLYEYMPDDEECKVIWTPAEPTKNAPKR